MAAKAKAKKAKPAKAKPAKKAAAPAKPKGPEISSDLRKVALAHALRRLK